MRTRLPTPFHASPTDAARVLFENAGTGMVVADTDGVFTEVNPAFANMLGCEPQELVGHRADDYYHDDDREDVQRNREKLRSGACIQSERRFRHRRGHFVWTRTRMQAWCDAAGKSWLLATVDDVDKHRRAQEALRESEERFRIAFEEAPWGMAMLAPDQTFLHVNNTAARIFGYVPEEMIGRSWSEVTQGPSTPSDTPSEPQGLARGLRSGADHRCVRKDGQPVWIRGSGTLVRHADGRPEYVISQFEDVSDERQRTLERRHLEEQLRRSQRMETVGRLAGGVAHDFNNMLAIIINFADLSRLRSTDHRVREYGEQIHKAASRAAALTRRLMIFGRRDFVVAEVLDLNRVILDIRQLLQRTLGEDIHFDTALEPGLKSVCLGLPHLEQVLMNLTVNARDAMPKGGVLQIRTANVRVAGDDPRALTPGDYVSLSVKDTGLGMSPEVQALVFEPFFSTKEVGRGTGLGLSIVHHIVEAASGHVSVRSRPGEGALFEVLLPTVSHAAPEASRSHGEDPSRGHGEHILVVEDEPALLDLTVQLLREQGFVPIPAEGADAALRHSANTSTRFDLLLSDIIMPRMSGTELARRIREQRPGMRVLFMSGHTEERLATHDVRASGVAFLPKPFTATELMHAIQRILET